MAVSAFVSLVEARLAVAEARATLLAAHADAAATRGGAAAEAARIRLDAYAEISALHERAIAEVARLEAGCHRLTSLLDSVDAALAVRTEAAADLHIVLEPDAEHAMDATPRS